MNLPPIEINLDEWEIVRELLQRHLPGREVWAFGSRVKRIAKPFSDLDLVILGSQPLTLSAMADLADDFTESDLPFKVDLVDWATTSPRFRAVIEAGYVVIQHPASGEAEASRGASIPDSSTWRAERPS
jgi:predicted nucleotidyltransferase